MLSRSGVSCAARRAKCHPAIKKCHHGKRVREPQRCTFLFSRASARDASSVITRAAESTGGVGCSLMMGTKCAKHEAPLQRPVAGETPRQLFILCSWRGHGKWRGRHRMADIARSAASTTSYRTCMVGRKRNPVHPALLGSALRLARATSSSVVGQGRDAASRSAQRGQAIMTVFEVWAQAPPQQPTRWFGSERSKTVIS